MHQRPETTLTDFQLACQQATDEAATGTVSLEAVISRGRARATRRRALTVVGATAVAAVALFLGFGTVAPQTTVAPAGPAPHAAGVRTVRAGEQLQVGSGATLWLNRTGYCSVEQGQRTCKDLFDANHGGIPSKGGSLGMQAHGVRGELRIVGSYRGQGTVARITVDYRGKRTEASVVRLADAKGWVVLYAVLPASPVRAAGKRQPELTVYNAAGQVLGQLS